MYSLLLGVIYVVFISLGLPDSLLGAGWPVMNKVFNVPVSYMGIITMIISGCTILSSLFSDRITKKFGTRIVTMVSVFLTAGALFGFSVSQSFLTLIIFSVPYGLGAGAIDAALNNYVAIHYTSKHMSWLHCFWGVGTIVSPFIMSLALIRGNWNDGYTFVAVIQLAIGLLVLLTLPLWKVNQIPQNGHEDGKSIGVLNALRIKGVPFLLLGFFAYCAAECTAMTWASTYFFEVFSLNEKTCAAYGSLFFIGLTFGRFAGGFLMDKTGDRKMILTGTLVASLGVIMLALPAKNPVFAIAGFVTIGLGYAPIYPCIIHATPSNFGAENSGAIIGIQMASAYTGSTFMPPLYGILGKALGFQIMPYYLIAFMILMVIMIEKTFSLTQKQA